MTLKSVITLANSIIGVSILAMPFCFKQCGILLATLMIVLSGFIVKMACHLLLKSAILARSRTYEFLGKLDFKTNFDCKVRENLFQRSIPSDLRESWPWK